MSNIFSSPLVLESVFRDVFRDVFDVAGTALSAYAVAGFDPALVFDFDDEYYRTGGSSSTFSSAITHSRAGRATMVDSDGLLKWAPHNLALNSATPATQSITVISGADYTVECTGVSIALSGAGSGTVTEGNPVTITASTTTLTLTVTGSTGTMWAYRADLGGMVDNPDTGDSYVPTTSSIRHLARRGHHIWNGSAWVNEGMLHESEPRTNLLPYSQDFTNAAWQISNTNSLTRAGGAGVGPDGLASLNLLTITDTTNENKAIFDEFSATTNAVYTLSCFVKDVDQRYVALRAYRSNTNWSTAVFDLTTGAVTQQSNGATSGTITAATIQDYGGGLYRIALTSAQAGTVLFFAIDFANSGTPTLDANNGYVAYAGTAGVGLYAGFAQGELGSTPSSYAPTSGAQFTRAADTLTVPSANLPWPTPNVIGPELVTNGTFDADVSGWTAAGAGASIVWSSGAMQVTGSTAFEGVSQTLTLPSGKVYLLSCDYVRGSASQVRLAAQGFSGQPTATGTAASGSLQVIAVSSGVSNIVRVDIGSVTAGDFYVDNISVREIDPLAVSIQMQGRATGNTYTTTRWSLDASNEILQQIGTTNFTFTQEAAGVVDTVTGGSFTSGINTPFNFASTHASTLVAAAVGGTALTDNPTPVALPNLSATNLNLGHSFMGTLKLMRVWSADITEAGREEAST